MKHIHILGVCGTFMGSLAVLAKQKGYKVTGADQNVYPPMSTYLESQGIEIIQGFDISQLELRPDEIIIGNIMRRGMPIVEKILDEKLNYFSGPSWLYENILKHKKVIALSGTHGKTTTTTMTIKILEEAGLNPSFLVGGISGDFGVSSRYTEDSEYFAIEADEYDTAFFDKRSKLIHYDPHVLVINNIEYDHADIFDDIQDIYWQFHQLLRRMPSVASVVYNASDEHVQEIVNMGCWSNRVKTNIEGGIYISKHNDDYSEFSIVNNGTEVEIAWGLIGEHNALNAVSAYAATRQIGVSDEDIIRALNSFNGVKRRLEIIYNDKNVTLYDDFAHHPTSIRLTLDAVRNKNQDAHVIALIDPRSNTMKEGNNKYYLPQAIQKADSILFYNHKLLKWDAQDVLKDIETVEYLADALSFEQKIWDEVTQNKGKKIEIVMMSNGSFDGLREALPKLLENLCQD